MHKTQRIKRVARAVCALVLMGWLSAVGMRAEASGVSISRCVSLSGLTGTATVTDPIWCPVEGGSTPLSGITYTTLGGNPAFSLTVDSQIWWQCAPPRMLSTLASDQCLSCDVQFAMDNTDTTRGVGLFLLDYSAGLYGTNSNGFGVQINGNSATVFTKSGATFTTVSTISSVPTGSAVDFKVAATVTADGTGFSIALYNWSGSAWTQIGSTVSGSTVTNNKIYLACWRRKSGCTAIVGGGPANRNGPIYETTAQPFVLCPIGQSELSGFGNTGQSNSNTNVIGVNRSTGDIGTLTDPWEFSAAASSAWNGVLAEPQSGGHNPTGGFITTLAVNICNRYGGCITVPMWTLGGAQIANLSPPTTSSRTNLMAVTSLGGAATRMVEILAGDGRNSGQTVAFGFYHTTGNMTTTGWTGSGVTDKASYKALVQGVIDRLAQLWPASYCYVAKLGDRTWRYPGQTTVNQDIRDTDSEIIAGNTNCKLWFDESGRTGLPGSNTPWPDLANAYGGVHPGPLDNAWLSAQATTGILGGVVQRRTPGRGRTGTRTGPGVWDLRLR